MTSYERLILDSEPFNYSSLLIRATSAPSPTSSHRLDIIPADLTHQSLSFLAFASLEAPSGHPPPLVRFWRDVDSYVSSVLQTTHFHIDVVPQTSGFSCLLLFGSSLRQPPKPRAACISCDTHHPIAQACLLRETPHNRVWMDAKLRPFYIVTPTSHVESLAVLSDAQLLAFWREGLDLVREHALACAGWEERALFERLTVNFGDYRNLAHLHLKIKLKKSIFKKIQANWPPGLQEKRQSAHMLASNPDNMRLYIGGTFRA